MRIETEEQAWDAGVGSWQHSCYKTTKHVHGHEGWICYWHYSRADTFGDATGQRYVDEAGARRFCKKWGIEFPDEVA